MERTEISMTQVGLKRSLKLKKGGILEMDARYPYSSLAGGSKNRLDDYQARLKRDQDERNFDKKLCQFISEYRTDSWESELEKTREYLYRLRSSKDGKLFSQGVKDYGKLKKNALAFAEANHTFFGWNENYKSAKEQMMKEFSSLMLNPIEYRSYDDIHDTLPKLDTHAGWSYILTGMRKKGEALGEFTYDQIVDQLKVAVENGSFNKPILVAVRTQGKGHAFDEDGNFTHDCDHKTRMVSMIDLIVIIAELIFAKPIQESMARAHWYAGGKNLDYGVARIISTLRSKYGWWYSLDYSSFDASISAWLIHDAFDIIRSAFPQLSEYHLRLLNVIENDFIEKDFVLGDEVIHSVRGVPSGSMFTQIVDSIVNRLVILTYMKSLHMDGDMIIMGDDNLLFSRSALDMELLSSYMRKNFGLSINAQKCVSGQSFTSPQFLSCEWRSSGRWREPHEVYSKMLYPERKRVYKRDRAKVEEVLWSYYLSYPLAVSQFINISKLLNDFPRLRNIDLSNVDSSTLPGFLRYVKTYNIGSWANTNNNAFVWYGSTLAA